MFEQTLLPDEKTSRKPYSIRLSLLIQIFFLGVLCAIPFVFTQVLPMAQLKSVLAAPAKPPVALKIKEPATRVTTATFRPLRIPELVLSVKRPAPAATAKNSERAPDIDIGDPTGVPFGASDGAEHIPQAIPPSAPAIKKPAPKTITIGGAVAAANLVHMVHPQYPRIAVASRIQGAVEFTAIISREGTIENLRLVRGHPLLIRAATEAVLQWHYRPTLLNGEPVEVITDITVNFTLNP